MLPGQKLLLLPVTGTHSGRRELTFWELSSDLHIHRGTRAHMLTHTVINNTKLKTTRCLVWTHNKWLTIDLIATISAGVGPSWYKTCLSCIKPWDPLPPPYKPNRGAQPWGGEGRDQKFKVIFNYIYWVWGQPRLHRPNLDIKIAPTNTTAIIIPGISTVRKPLSWCLASGKQGEDC